MSLRLGFSLLSDRTAPPHQPRDVGRYLFFSNQLSTTGLTALSLQ